MEGDRLNPPSIHPPPTRDLEQVAQASHNMKETPPQRTMMLPPASIQRHPRFCLDGRYHTPQPGRWQNPATNQVPWPAFSPILLVQKKNQFFARQQREPMCWQITEGGITGIVINPHSSSTPDLRAPFADQKWYGGCEEFHGQLRDYYNKISQHEVFPYPLLNATP